MREFQVSHTLSLIVSENIEPVGRNVNKVIYSGFVDGFIKIRLMAPVFLVVFTREKVEDGAFDGDVLYTDLTCFVLF